MKATIFDLLIRLFQAMGTNKQSDAEYFEYCVETLKSAGLNRKDLNHALSWLDKFSKGPHQDYSEQRKVVRIFSEQESRKISVQGQGFLLQLLRFGAIDMQTLEHILECAMELEVSEINLNQLKWIVVMLASAEFKNQAYAEWLEHTILQADSLQRVLH
jgi:Smg protein